MQSMQSKSEVLSLLNISERTLENMVKKGNFPPGVRLGRQMFWLTQAIQKWQTASFQTQLNFEMDAPGRRLGLESGTTLAPLKVTALARR